MTTTWVDWSTTARWHFPTPPCTWARDIIHVGEVQFPEPAITITYDVDRKQAAQVREAAFATFTHDGTLIAIPHLAFPGVGHIRAAGTGYEWLPIIYGNRDTSRKWQ